MPAQRLRKSPRLKEFDYIGPLAAHVVCVTDFRHPFFAEPTLTSIAIDALQESARKLEATINAYCFMPDHAHILVAIPDGTSLEVFVKRFKQLAGFRAKQKTRQALWQPSYYEHLVRRDEDLADVAAYIWENPVVAGLVTGRDEYGFSGPPEVLSNTIGDASRYAPPRSFPDLQAMTTTRTNEI